MDYILTYANLVGNPSMTIKLGKNKNNGLPFNLTIDAKIYNDTKLFSHALYIEELIGDQNE
ncbi:amidase [Chlamydia abortus]|nr:amidase [Chlamydia abortus]